MRMWGLSLAAIGIVVAAACGGGGGETTTTGPGNNQPGNGNNNNNPNTVTLVDSSFNPANITIKAGQTVTWQWTACADTTGGYVAMDGRLHHAPDHVRRRRQVRSPRSRTRARYNRTFASAGTIKYHCTIHGSYMSGQVVVQ